VFIEKEQIIIFPPVKNTPVIVRSNSFMGEYGSIEGTVVNVEEALPRKTDKIFAKLGFKPKPKYDVSVSVEPDFTTRWHPLTIIIKGVNSSNSSLIFDTCMFAKST